MSDKTISLCKEAFGWLPSTVEQLPLSGSWRKYFRVRNGACTYIVCESENKKENWTFIRLANYLHEAGIAVPAILAVNDDYSAYILEDLGSLDLLTYILKSRSEGRKYIAVVQNTIDQLVQFQLLPKEDWSQLVEFPPLDQELIQHDCRYAFDNFFSVKNPAMELEDMEEDFKTLEMRLLSYPEEFWGLMYRDFQSRNVMLNPTPYFIDFQSARKGPGIYDIVSFAWQARAGFSSQERSEIVEMYIDSLKKRGFGNTEIIKEEIDYWALFRVIQTLGAYGLRGLKEGKVHFLASIPQAVANFEYLLESLPPGQFRALRKLKIKN